MKRKLLLCGLLLFLAGTTSAKSIIDTPALCPACTNYCKLHPNSPRCL